MTAPAIDSNVTRQLRYQRNRRGQGQVRRWFWLDAATLALYDRLLRAYGYGGKEKMMADALRALEVERNFDVATMADEA
jgi:hypothetical protein